MEDSTGYASFIDFENPHNITEPGEVKTISSHGFTPYYGKPIWKSPQDTSIDPGPSSQGSISKSEWKNRINKYLSPGSRSQKLDISAIGAVSNEVGEKLSARSKLKQVMKDANLLHEPTEELDIDSIIYFEEKKENNLLFYKEQLKAQQDAIDKATRISELAWQDMSKEITNAEATMDTKMTTDQKKKICDMVMKLTYDIEKEKIDLRFPLLKLK